MRKRQLVAIGIIFLLRFLSCQMKAVAQQDLSQNNLVIVMDDSGSMDGILRSSSGESIKKMEAAKKALKDVLKNLPASTNVGLVALNGGWIYELSPSNRSLNEAIDKLSPDGHTPLGECIKVGADRLLQQRQQQHGYGSFSLLIITDGEADWGSPVDEYTKDVLSRGITVDVIGVDMAKDHTLATKVNSYRNVLDPVSLHTAVAQVVAESMKSGKDGVDEDAFALIAALPDGFPEAIIKALSETGNHPIGTKPERKKIPKGDKSSSAESSNSKEECFIGFLVEKRRF